MLSYLSGAPLSRCCTFLTGGRAKRLAFAYDTDDLICAAQSGALVLGRGSNVLFGDCGYCGDVVVNRTSKVEFSADECQCDSGVAMTALARRYEALARSGLEWACGLPGTAGGAVVGNAGAFGGSMSDSLVCVTVYHDGREKTYKACECGFGYRTSGIKGTVLRVVLKAPKGDAREILQKGESNLLKRRQTQPSGASAGSVFKAAGDTPAAVLIERAGLKGYAVGGAQISSKHANFIINRGGATSGDILELLNTAKGAVYDKFGIKLEREIKLLGDFF